MTNGTNPLDEIEALAETLRKAAADWSAKTGIKLPYWKSLAASAIPALRAQLAGEGWRTMESAPVHKGVLAAWDAGRSWIIQPCIQSENGTWMTKWDSDIVHPTHWRPLPAPPAPAETETLANQEPTP